jgi:hypothetical protein
MLQYDPTNEAGLYNELILSESDPEDAAGNCRAYLRRHPLRGDQPTGE